MAVVVALGQVSGSGGRPPSGAGADQVDSDLLHEGLSAAAGAAGSLVAGVTRPASRPAAFWVVALVAGVDAGLYGVVGQ